MHRVALQKIGKKIKEMELLHCKEPGQNVGPEPGLTGRADRSGRPVGRTGRIKYQRISFRVNQSEPVGPKIQRAGPVGPTGPTAASAHKQRRILPVVSHSALRKTRTGRADRSDVLLWCSKRSRRPVQFAALTYWNGRTGRADRSDRVSTARSLLVSAWACLSRFTSLPLRWLEYKRQHDNPD